MAEWRYGGTDPEDEEWAYIVEPKPDTEDDLIVGWVSRKLAEQVIADHNGQARAAALTVQLASVAAQRDELDALFDLIHRADMRAIAQWRAAHPGNDLVQPDRVKMVLWLLERLAQVTAEREAIANLSTANLFSIDYAEERAEKAESVLAELEWCVKGLGRKPDKPNVVTAVRYCPVCDRAEFEGHAADCRLAAIRAMAAGGRDGGGAPTLAERIASIQARMADVPEAEILAAIDNADEAGDFE